MNTHDIGEPAELAALYAGGAMSAQQSAEFESHMESCGLCRAEVAELSGVVGLLSEAVEHPTPPQRVRDTLMMNIATTDRSVVRGDGAAQPALRPAPSASAAQVWKKWSADQLDRGLIISRSGEGDWEETGIAGVRVKRLSADPQRDQFTALVRMEPGTSYPGHQHNGPEECLVLEGELHVGDTLLKSGDYQLAPAGTLHGVQSTKTGCLLLIVSSMSDEMLDE